MREDIEASQRSIAARESRVAELESKSRENEILLSNKNKKVDKAMEVWILCMRINATMHLVYPIFPYSNAYREGSHCSVSVLTPWLYSKIEEVDFTEAYMMCCFFS